MNFVIMNTSSNLIYPIPPETGQFHHLFMMVIIPGYAVQVWFRDQFSFHLGHPLNMRRKQCLLLKSLPLHQNSEV